MRSSPPSSRSATTSSRDRRALHGLLAGALGTLALTAFERLEWRVIRRVAIYAPRSIARHFVDAWWAKAISRREARWLGAALRWLYGPSLGLLLERLAPTRRSSFAFGTGVVAGFSIYTFEIIAMPIARATPPLRRWPPAERLLLLAHATVFGVTTSALLHALSGARNIKQGVEVQGYRPRSRP